jgi:hypothetical protein
MQKLPNSCNNGHKRFWAPTTRALSLVNACHFAKAWPCCGPSRKSISDESWAQEPCVAPTQLISRLVCLCLITTT